MRNVVAAMRDLAVSVGKFVRAFGLVIVGAAATFPVFQWVTSAANSWAGPFAIAGLMIFTLSMVGFFRMRRYAWILYAPFGFGAALSLGLALVNGWDAQVQAALDILEVAMIVGVGGAVAMLIAMLIAMFVVIWRARRADENLISEAGEDIRSDVPFRDDGERIEVYPPRRKMFRPILTGVIAVLICTGAMVWMLQNGAPFLVIGAVGFIGAFFALMLALWLIRLIMRGPSLAIGPDGIEDRGSAIVTGRGLLPWNNVLGVFVDDRKTRFATYHHFGIGLTDMASIRARQPRWKRPLLLLFGQMSALHIIIAQSLLDRPAQQLVTQIETYANEHAPAGSWHSGWKDDEPPVRWPSSPPSD